MKLAFFIGVILLSCLGCSRSSDPFEVVYSFPKLQKSSQILIQNRMEATPFVWNDGRLLYLVSHRAGTEGASLEIWESGQQLTSHPTKLGLMSALMYNGRLYVMGTTNWASRNEVKLMSTDDLINWTEPVTVLTADPGKTIFNTSLTKDNDGFVMAYELCETGHVCFSVRFAKSQDLVSWNPVGSTLKEGTYTACPTIRYVAGNYYVFYLRNVGHYVTYVAKTADFSSWQESPHAVLSSLGQSDEGINNSDMDLIEFNGGLIISYAVGNQSNDGGWAHIKTATYPGSLTSFVDELFP